MGFYWISPIWFFVSLLWSIG